MSGVGCCGVCHVSSPVVPRASSCHLTWPVRLAVCADQCCVKVLLLALLWPLYQHHHCLAGLQHAALPVLHGPVVTRLQQDSTSGCRRTAPRVAEPAHAGQGSGPRRAVQFRVGTAPRKTHCEECRKRAPNSSGHTTSYSDSSLPLLRVCCDVRCRTQDSASETALTHTVGNSRKTASTCCRGRGVAGAAEEVLRGGTRPLSSRLPRHTLSTGTSASTPHTHWKTTLRP